MNPPFETYRPPQPQGDSASPPDVFSGQARRELASHALYVIDADGLVDNVQADRGKLVCFVEEASKRYRRNPYHNWFHAVNVAQCMAWLVGLPAFKRGLPAVDRFWLLVAAACHDLDHPGYSRQWDASSMRTGEGARRSVGDRHALEALRELMARDDCDFASTMSEEDQIRGSVLLAELLRVSEPPDPAQFMRRFTADLGAWGPKADLGNAGTRIQVLSTLMAAAEVSHVAQPFADARHWALRQMEETWAQGRKARALGLAVHEWNDETRTTLEHAQILFIRLYVLELLQALVRIEPAVAQLVERVKENLACYEAAATVESNLYGTMTLASR